MEYKVKSSTDLTANEIKSILDGWGIVEWSNLTSDEFTQKFINSEFHTLYDGGELVSLCRINNDFSFKIDGKVYKIAEMVGLVSLVKGSGYGKELLTHLRANQQSRDIECIGFCYAHNRGFYQKCGIEVLEGYAKFFKEPSEKKGEWIASDDDDVICVNLSAATILQIKGLNKANFAYLEVKNIDLPEVCRISQVK